jgi:D-glycero-D-manno-heptose 1,7-bisphosphate phosphatase
LFLDRDGTINAGPEVGRYIRDADQLQLLPGAAEAIKTINDSDALAVVISNQRWLSFPGVSRTAYRAVDERLRLLLSKEGAHLDACFVCPHQLGRCACRKPAPGMLLRAAEDFGLDLCSSVAVGDSPCDVAAGRAVGARCILLSQDRPHRAAAVPSPDRVFTNLVEAVEWAL